MRVAAAAQWSIEGAGRTITQFDFPQTLEHESIRGFACDDQADDELTGMLTGIQDGDALGNVQRRGQRPADDSRIHTRQP